MELQLYTVPQVAKILNVSRSTVYGLVRAGHLPTVRIGRSVRVPAQAVRDLVEGLTTYESAGPALTGGSWDW